MHLPVVPSQEGLLLFFYDHFFQVSYEESTLVASLEESRFVIDCLGAQVYHFHSETFVRQWTAPDLQCVARTVLRTALADMDAGRSR